MYVGILGSSGPIAELAEVNRSPEHALERSLLAAVDEQDDVSFAAVEVDEITEDLLAIHVVDCALELVEVEDHRLAGLLGEP